MFPVSQEETLEIAARLRVAKKNLTDAHQQLSDLYSYIQERMIGLDDKTVMEIKQMSTDNSSISFMIGIQRYQVLQFPERIIRNNDIKAADRDCGKA